MNMNFQKIIALFILYFLLSAPSVMAQDTPRAVPSPARTEDRKSGLAYDQLRNYLMNYADQYMQMIGQAADTIQRYNANPRARVGIHSIKLFPCSAAFSIAIEQNPQIALLDMVVLVHLQGRVWEKSTLKEKYGDSANALYAAQKSLKTDIDGIALRALKAEQLENIKTLVDEWLKKHPDQRYVSYIRFTDFAELKSRPRENRAPNILSIAGLLSAFQLVNMDETTRSVDQARMVAERALYLAQRMPTILRWQLEMLLYEVSNETYQQGQKLIWETAKALLVVAIGVFFLALLFRIISKKL